MRGYVGEMKNEGGGVREVGEWGGSGMRGKILGMRGEGGGRREETKSGSGGVWE